MYNVIHLIVLFIWRVLHHVIMDADGYTFEELAEMVGGIAAEYGMLSFIP